MKLSIDFRWMVRELLPENIKPMLWCLMSPTTTSHWFIQNIEVSLQIDISCSCSPCKHMIQ